MISSCPNYLHADVSDVTNGWRFVSPSTGGDWWATCHDESYARYIYVPDYCTPITRRAQGCKQAGCRRRQERHSSPSDSFNSKYFTNSHEEQLYPNPLGVNVSDVFLHTIGVSESPWLFRSPLPCSVPWQHHLCAFLLYLARFFWKPPHS